MKSPLLKKCVFSVVSLVIMILFAACSGVGTPVTGTTLSGTITSVDAAHHSVTITSGGQSYTITGLTDQEIQVLSTQINKVYTIHVTQNSDGSYTLTSGTEPTPGAEPETPGANNATPSTSTGVGSISFTGPVQSASASSLTVKLPDNSTITMGINASTDQSDLNGAQLTNGQLVKIEANAANGSFTATKIKHADNSDNIVDFQGQTTQAVGSDNVLHFSVGGHSYSYAISSTAKLDDFGGNAHSIASGASVKVEVMFTGTTGSITKIRNVSN
jgi:hypothetical protein